MIDYVSSFICAMITFGMALLQLSITFGAPFGEYVLGGQNKVLPPKMRFTSGTFFGIFTIIGMTYLQRGSILRIGFNPMFVKIVIIVNTLFLAYAIIGNGIITKSKKEKYVMTPFSIIQFMFSLVALLFT